MTFRTALGLILSVLLVAPGPAGAAKDAPNPAGLAELAAVSAELQENTKDLRRNITHWQKISQDANLAAAEKQQWHQKATAYLQECLAYNTLLAQVDIKKIPDAAAAQRFAADRRTFQRELLFFQEMLQKP